MFKKDYMKAEEIQRETLKMTGGYGNVFKINLIDLCMVCLVYSSWKQTLRMPGVLNLSKRTWQNISVTKSWKAEKKSRKQICWHLFIIEICTVIELAVYFVAKIIISYEYFQDITHLKYAKFDNNLMNILALCLTGGMSFTES